MSISSNGMNGKKLLLISFIIVFWSLIIFSIAGYFETEDSYGEMSEMIAYSHEHILYIISS